MAMAACYPTYDHMTGGSTNVGSVQQLQQQQQSPVAATSQLHHLSSRLSAAAAAAAEASEKLLFAAKYRQHQRASHRLHPYMMSSGFTPLMTAAFPPMQQVSCYNV